MSPHQLNHLRCLAIILISVGLANDSIQAGCQYAHQVASTQRLNPRDHARNFHFMGQWIYEGGQIKYVAYQSDEPCDGPACRNHAPESQPLSLAPQSTDRLPTSLAAAIIAYPVHSLVNDGRIQLGSEATIQLYQAVPLKPPRV